MTWESISTTSHSGRRCWISWFALSARPGMTIIVSAEPVRSCNTAYQNLSSWPFACFARFGLSPTWRKPCKWITYVFRRKGPPEQNFRAKTISPHHVDARQCRHRAQQLLGRRACSPSWRTACTSAFLTRLAGHLSRGRALHRLAGYGLADDAHRQTRLLVATLAILAAGQAASALTSNYLVILLLRIAMLAIGAIYTP